MNGDLLDTSICTRPLSTTFYYRVSLPFCKSLDHTHTRPPATAAIMPRWDGMMLVRQGGTNGRMDSDQAGKGKAKQAAQAWAVLLFIARPCTASQKPRKSTFLVALTWGRPCPSGSSATLLTWKLAMRDSLQVLLFQGSPLIDGC
jgi:hypothetical protein